MIGYFSTVFWKSYTVPTHLHDYVFPEHHYLLCTILYPEELINNTKSINSSSLTHYGHG